jgi:hypothetical protein
MWCAETGASIASSGRPAARRAVGGPALGLDAFEWGAQFGEQAVSASEVRHGLVVVAAEQGGFSECVGECGGRFVLAGVGRYLGQRRGARGDR